MNINNNSYLCDVSRLANRRDRAMMLQVRILKSPVSLSMRTTSNQCSHQFVCVSVGTSNALHITTAWGVVHYGSFMEGVWRYLRFMDL